MNTVIPFDEFQKLLEYRIERCSFRSVMSLQIE